MSTYTDKEFEKAKILGGVGVILTLLGLVPKVGLALNVIGLILILVSLKMFSDYYRNEDIFRYALIAVIIGIIGGVVLAAGAVSLGLKLALFKPTPPVTLKHLTLPLIGLAIAVWILAIMSTYFFKRSYDLLGEHTGEKMFKTAALLLFIGAILTIIVVGAFISLVADILLAVAFFTVKPKAPSPKAVAVAPPPPPPPPPPA